LLFHIISSSHAFIDSATESLIELFSQPIDDPSALKFFSHKLLSLQKYFSEAAESELFDVCRELCKAVSSFCAENVDSLTENPALSEEIRALTNFLVDSVGVDDKKVSLISFDFFYMLNNCLTEKEEYVG